MIKKHLLSIPLSFCLCAICLCITAALLLWYHFTRQEPRMPLPSVTPASSAAPTPDTPESRLSDALQKLLDKGDFHVSTRATIHLKGHLIKGTRQIKSRIEVQNALDADNMQMDMTTETVSGKKTKQTHSSYSQGWYSTDDGKSTSRIERSGESVLSMVTFVADILRDASGQTENMKISKEGNDTVYRFSLPGDMATEYFTILTEQAALNTKELKNVSGEVDSLRMMCRINEDGILTEQTARLTGSVSKSIFTIPVSIKETSVFTVME